MKQDEIDQRAHRNAFRGVCNLKFDIRTVDTKYAVWHQKLNGLQVKIYDAISIISRMPKLNMQASTLWKENMFPFLYKSLTCMMRIKLSTNSKCINAQKWFSSSRLHPMFLLAYSHKKIAYRTFQNICPRCALLCCHTIPVNFDNFLLKSWDIVHGFLWHYQKIFCGRIGFDGAKLTHCRLWDVAVGFQTHFTEY